MTSRIEKIIAHIHQDNADSFLKALDEIEGIKNLKKEEKYDLTAALTTIFYHHDHSGITDMVPLALRAEHQIAKLGIEVVPFLIEELINADAESAAYLGKTIALSGCPGIDMILNAWNEQWEDDFALINIIQTISYFKDPNVTRAMPQLLVACKSSNFQVRAIALYTIGKLSVRLAPNLFDDNMRGVMIDTLIELLKDQKSLVRKNAARALGKMQKRGILNEKSQTKAFNAFNSILGLDGKHKWDRAFIVRHEAKHFIPYFETKKPFATKYNQSFKIVGKRELCDKTYHFEIEVPLIAKKIQAGQFIIVRPNPMSERIPLSVCGWDPKKGTLQIIVMAVGKTSTEINNMKPGDTFTDIVGPLGKRSHVKKHKGTCIVIGGGYGTGAIIPTAKDLRRLGNRVIGIVGAKNKDLLIMEKELSNACDQVICTTNDGSYGVKGFVTDALSDVIQNEKVSHVLAVGPVPMMKAVSDLTKPHKIETYVSLNAIMVDGTGMCGACRVSIDGEIKFACFHGPDFNGHKVDFDQLEKRQKMFVKEEKIAFDTLNF